MPASKPTIAISYYEDRGNPLKHQLFDRLRSWTDLRILHPETEHPDLAEMGFDFYHMAAWRHAALADLRRARKAEVPTLNSYHGAATTEDRLARCRTLRNEGVRVPPFEFGRAEQITLGPPVLVKPRHELGDGGHEFRVVYSGSLEFDGERFVERYVVPRRSYKIFGVGDQTRATRHIPPDGTPKEVETPRRFRELTAEIADLFDLGLFELDVVVHKGLYVIDVNPVVSLAGVDDAVDIYESLLREAVRSA
ncbi:ATP-grasp domain-containing protein [Halorussus halophilus]|uniref:ATP-grasp domain-containing protein n=1 Tax=Halorussus halophilus TaxID=2650975 RepID=UPI0013017FE7|nr:hypothetical protein [Halorussus halophilus]